jgi:ATP synthase protein I
MADSNHDPQQRRRKLTEAIFRRTERKLRARRERHRGVWFGLGMFGLVGWAVAIPALLGTAIGYWLDRRTAGSVSWTLTLLLVGVVIGCFNAWYWVRQESRLDGD